MRVNSIEIDYTETKPTELCVFGALEGTDKSVWNNKPHLHKHPYTALYYDLMAQYKEKPIRIAEIGIEDNSSTRMWRNFFTEAQIDLYEYYQEKIDKALQDNLTGVEYMSIDVSQNARVHYAFNERYKETGRLYQFIIDDSTHNIDDQIRIIFEALKFLEPRGKMIIEDIFREEVEDKYIEALEPIKHEIEELLFVETNHELEHSPGWNNSKLLIITKK